MKWNLGLNAQEHENMNLNSQYFQFFENLGKIKTGIYHAISQAAMMKFVVYVLV